MEAGDEDFLPTLEWPTDGASDSLSEEPFLGNASKSLTRLTPRSDTTADGGGSSPGGSSSPAMAERVEDVNGALARLSMRVDAQTVAATGFRAALSHRINEHADTIARLTSAQNDAIEEYRRATDRSLAELRNAVGENDRASRRVAGRIEEIWSSIGTLAADLLAFTTRDAEPNDTEVDRRVADELAQLRAEVRELKHRVGLRGRTTVQLDDAQLDRIVDAVAGRFESAFERVSEKKPGPPKKAAAPPRRQRSR